MLYRTHRKTVSSRAAYPFIYLNMFKTFFFDIAPWLGYGFFIIAPLIQAWRLHKRKQSGDISISYFLLLLLSQALLIPRLYQTADTTLLFGHLATVAANLVALAVTLYYRKKASQS